MATPSSENNTTNDEEKIIDHVVLFNVRDEEQEDDPSEVNAMITALNNLPSLDPTTVLYSTAGPILRTRSLPPSLTTFTHLLHSRSLSRDHHHLSLSRDHHLSLVHSLLHPISHDDVISHHWVGPDPPTPSPRAGSGMRFVSLKVADDVEEKERVLEGFRKIQESLGPFVQISYGVNISISNTNNKEEEEGGKGFSVAALAVFPDLNELDASEEFEDQIRSLIHKFKVSDDQIIAVDYVVPRLSPTSFTVE